MLSLAEVVTLSVTVVTCASLWLAGVIDKRVRKEEEPGVEILPYQKISIGDPCPICGDITDIVRGISRAPQLCKSDDCPASPRAHLHVRCDSCHGMCFMATRPVSPPVPSPGTGGPG